MADISSISITYNALNLPDHLGNNCMVLSERGAFVIAPDATFHFDTSNGDSQIYDNWYNKEGHWNIYYNGELKEQLNGVDPWSWGEDAVQLNNYLKGKTAEQLIKQYSNGNEKR